MILANLKVSIRRGGFQKIFFRGITDDAKKFFEAAFDFYSNGIYNQRNEIYSEVILSLTYIRQRLEKI